MQGLVGQLYAVLYWDELHGWQSGCFTNILSISSIVLVGFYIGLNELRHHQLDCMPQSLQFIYPVMGTASMQTLLGGRLLRIRASEPTSTIA